jgi:predicted ATPase/DNA-binding SARP family transcriptional activator
LEFRVLGPVEVEEGDRKVALGGPKARAVLAILLLQRGEVVSAERLIELLYDGLPPEKASKSVQAHVSRLRKALGGGRVRTAAGGYALDLSPGELDVDRFDELAEQGRSLLAAARPEQAAAVLRQALALWRGTPYADFRYSEFARSEIARLEERRLVVLGDRIEADFALGRHADLVPELEALVSEHRLREKPRAQLMLALYRSGRQVEALEAYQDARKALTDELGIEPSPEVRELQQKILRQDASLHQTRAPEATAAPEASTGAFVGRVAELEMLRSGLDQAFHRQGRLFLLVGEPGIGKSRLAEELAHDATARGAQVVVGRAWEAGGAPAYWPWVQSLRALVRATADSDLRNALGVGAGELAELLPELRERMAEIPLPNERDPETARFRLFEAVSSLLVRAGRQRPVLLILDDLHAADEPSLLMLRFVARELAQARVLVLAAYRDVDPTPTDPLTMTVTELLREPATQALHLSGLRKDDVASFIELVSGEAASNELISTIHEETEGNPLFVGEIVRLLAAEGRLDDSSRVPIPQSVRDVIARRLRHLSEECNRILVLASVLGREFNIDVLAQMADRSEDELLATLDGAMSARVVSEIPGSPARLRFAHILIRDTLYENVTFVRRLQLHRLAVAALEPLYGSDAGPHLAELALHAVAGGQFEKGIDYARPAGDHALALLAYEEAARLYALALDALSLSEQPDEATRCELLLSLGEAEGRAGNTAAAREAFLHASDLARQLGRPHEFGRAVIGYGGRLVWARAGQDERLVPLFEEALETLAERDVQLRVRLLARLSGALRDELSRERRDSLSREAVELARRTNDLGALAYALDGRGAAIFGPDTLSECLDVADELIKVGTRIRGDRERVAHGLFLRFVAKMTLGDVAEATADLDAEEQLACQLRQPSHLWQVQASRTMLALATGQLEQAEPLAAAAFAFGERAHPEFAVPQYTLHLYAIAELRGQIDASLDDRVRDLARRYPSRAVFAAFVAHAHVCQGRLDEAEKLLSNLAGNEFSAFNFDMEWLLATALLAEIAVALGAKDHMATLYRLISPWGHLNVVDVPEGARGSAARYLGLLATGLTRWVKAERHYEFALAMNARTGARPWHALTQQDYAHLLLERDAQGDKERATQLLHEATATFHELGMIRAPKLPQGR